MEQITGNISLGRVLGWIALICIILIITLFILETYTYYFATAGSAKTKNLITVTDKYVQNEGFDVQDPKDEVKQFPDIIDYIEKVEEPQFYQNPTNKLGCYDNNDLISLAHPGESCKSWYPKVTDIFFKPKSTSDVPSTTVNTQNLNNYFNIEGQTYTFAELCPETTGQKNPIACLYDRAQAYDIMSTKIANINDSIQNQQDKKISNLSDDASWHIIDANRTYNQSHVRDFMGYERSLGLGTNIYGGKPNDQLNDISLYSRKQRVNYLANK